MTTNKIGGYSLIVGSIVLFLSGMVASGRVENSLEILGFTLIICAVFAFTDHLRGDSDNGLLRLAPILVLIGFTAFAYSAAVDTTVMHQNVESVNAVKGVSSALGSAMGAIGFLGMVCITALLLNRNDFTSNVFYRAFTGLALLAFTMMSALHIAIPYLFEGRDSATVAGVPGDGNMAIAMGALIAIWMSSMVIITLWSIWTGVILSRKS